MLSYTPMKKLAGIRLEGDYHTLRMLHDTIHEMTQDDRQPYADADVLIALAYDVRKAYERQRDVIEPNVHYPEMGVRYGVDVIWPMLLLQSRQIREALAWGPSLSRQQACAYALEHVIEQAIKSEFGRTADLVMAAWRRIDPRSPDVVERHDPIGAMFSSWTKTERAKRTHVLLGCYDAMHSDLIHGIAIRNGQDHISPTELAQWAGREWIDPITGLH